MKQRRFKVQTLSIYQFLKRIPNEQAAREYVESLVWINGRYCPYCQSTETVEVKNEKPMPYRCKECRKHFSVKVGTVFESSKVSLQTWLVAIYLMSVAKKGVSSLQISRQLGVTQKTAWILCHKIRETWNLPVTKTMTGEIEVDESYFGGRERNKHLSKRLNMGRGVVGKQAVVGVRSRNGKIIGTVVKSVDRETLHDLIKRSAKEGAQIFSDGHRGYHGLEGYLQDEVYHHLGEYVRGRVHVNGIESFWSLLKRGYYGTFHYMSPKHLQRYVNEFASRQSMDKLDTEDIIAVTTRSAVGRHLSWKELTDAP